MVARRSTRKPVKTPRKRAVNVITKSKAAKDDIINIKFKSIGDLEFTDDGTPKDIPVETDYGSEKLALSRNLRFIIKGGQCTVLSTSKDGRRIKIQVPSGKTGSYSRSGWVKAEIIQSIEIVDKVRRVIPSSL